MPTRHRSEHDAEHRLVATSLVAEQPGYPGTRPENPKPDPDPTRNPTQNPEIYNLTPGLSKMTIFTPETIFLTFLVPKYLQKWPLKFQEWHFGPWSFKNDISAPLTSEFSFNTPILSEFHPYSIQLEYLSSSSLELYTRSVSATFLEFWLPTTLRNSRNMLSPSSEFNSPFNLFKCLQISEKDCMI